MVNHICRSDTGVTDDSCRFAKKIVRNVQSRKETDFVFGCDCGERYLADYRTQTIASHSGSSVIINRKDFNPAWNLAKIIKRGLGEVREEITETVENMQLTITIR